MTDHPRAHVRSRRPHWADLDDHRSGLATLWSDTMVYAARNIAHIRQIPEKLLDVTLQPLMFVLLFAYVFGGAIAVSGGNYREYVIAGILMQSLAFGMTGPATAIATDLTEGVIDRFRSLPASRAAYLLGHYVAELAGMVLSIVVLLGAGLRRRVAHPHRRRPRHRRAAAAAAVRLGHDLDRHVDRPQGAVPRRGHGRRVRGGLPADVPEQHASCRSTRCRRRCSTSPRGTRSA